MNHANIEIDLAVLINMMIISRLVYIDNASETTPIPSTVVLADGTGPDRVDFFYRRDDYRDLSFSPFSNDRDFRRYRRDRVQYRRTRILSPLSDEYY